MSGQRRKISDDRLDALLESARWDDPPRDAITRLRRTLLAAEEGGRRFRVRRFALAASMLIVIGGAISFALLRSESGRPHTIAVLPAEVERIAPTRVESRPPTIHERVMMRATARQSAPPPPPISLAATFELSLVRDRFLAARRVGSACDAKVVRELIAICEDGRSPQRRYRREALAALMTCDDPAAARYLQSLQSRPARRAELAAVKSELAQHF